MSEITPELEAAAKAAWAADRQDTAAWRTEAYPPAYYNRYVEIVRAALSAIREPTERMMHAMGVDHAKDRYVPIQEQNIIDGYTATIDSILSDTRTPTEGDLL